MSDGENTTKKKYLRRIAGAVLFCVAGVVISPAGKTAAIWQRENQPVLHSADLTAAMGQGVLLGMFGGLRSVLADISWIRGYAKTEHYDLAGCETAMRLSITLDPGNPYFRLVASDVIAYDSPYWIFSERGGPLWRKRLDPGVRKYIYREQAERGMALLKDGSRQMPENPDFYVRMAQLVENKFGDVAGAAEYYRQAAECPRPAWYASGIYVNFLFKKLGKKREAVAWYRDYIARLEAGNFGKNPMIDGVIGFSKERLSEMEKSLAAEK